MSERKKMTAKEARVLLGFPRDEDHNARYSLWRAEVQGFMQANGVENQTQAGTEKWSLVQEWAMDHRFTRGYKSSWKGDDALARKLHEALQTLLFDVRSKITKKRSTATSYDKALGIPPAASVRSRAVRAAAAAEAAAAPDSTAAYPQVPGLAPAPFQPKGVIVYLTDPHDVPGGALEAIKVLERRWGGKGVLQYVGMIYEPTMAHLVSLALRKQPEGSTRRVRNILGAMGDPVLGASGVVTQPPETVVLVDDEDVEGWLATTTASPLRLLAILERITPAGETAPAKQTPPPPGWQHIDHRAFGTLEEPIETSDDDQPMTKRRRRPTTKRGYEKLIEHARKRRNRLTAYMRELETQLHDRFPQASGSQASGSGPLFNNPGTPGDEEEDREETPGETEEVAGGE